MKSLLRTLLWLCAAAASVLTASAPAYAADKPRVLIFSHSTGYRHASIETGVAAIRTLGTEAGYDMVASEDPNLFTTEGLRDIDAIVFLSNSTKPDDPSSEWFQGARREALQAFVRRGGGIVGIHAATDSHYHWPWWGRLMGGRFARHPQGTPEGDVHVADRNHRTTNGLPQTMRRVDEWYYFDDYNVTSNVLLTLDPQSIGEADVNPNPVSWAHEFEGARVFYTAMGHTAESYADPNFLRHLRQGITWVLRRR